MADRTCSVPDCTKTPRSNSAEWCPMHYHRWYRHGSVDKVQTNEDTPTASKGRRYIGAYMPGHPVASRNGKVWMHRVVLYDAIGPGPHPCHWCAKPVEWGKGRGADALQVDHLNGWGDDNAIDNLVPSCPACNTTRGAQARTAALREAGWWSNHDTVEITQPRRPLIEA
jgi:hypothetical protein